MLLLYKEDTYLSTAACCSLVKSLVLEVFLVLGATVVFLVTCLVAVCLWVEELVLWVLLLPGIVRLSPT